MIVHVLLACIYVVFTHKLVVCVQGPDQDMTSLYHVLTWVQCTYVYVCWLSVSLSHQVTSFIRTSLQMMSMTANSTVLTLVRKVLYKCMLSVCRHKDIHGHMSAYIHNYIICLCLRLLSKWFFSLRAHVYTVSDGFYIVHLSNPSTCSHPPPPPNAYTVHVATLIWSEKEVTGYCPEGRRSHCAITYGSSVLYYGGYNAVYKQHFGDLFLLDTGGRVRESCMRMCLSISLFCSPPPPPYN